MSGDIRFGVTIPSGVLSELRGIDPGRQNEVIHDYVVRAEERGFHSVWVSDHLHQIRPQDGGGSIEAWTMLSAVSQYTSRVKLGQLVMAIPFRNPALLAKMAASLDILSQGRVILGIGAGWYESEFNGYGVPFLSPGKRLRALREGIAIIRGMLDGDSVQIDGEHFRANSPECQPLPIQQKLPLLIGGRGKVSLKIVAQHADIANFTGSLEDYIEARDRMEAYCEQIGRDPASIDRSWMTIGLLVRETQKDVDKALDALRQADDGRLPRLQFAGTPDRIIEKLSGFVEAGCKELILGLTDAPSLEAIDIFAGNVIPAFAGSRVGAAGLH